MELGYSKIALLLILLLFMVTLLVFFLRKKHVDSKELDIFNKLIVLNIIGLVLETALIASIIKLGNSNLFSQISMKLYLMYLIVFTYLMVTYVKYITNGNENKKSDIILILLSLLDIVIVTILPVDNVGEYSTFCTGPAVNAVYVYSGIYMFYSIIIMIMNYRTLMVKKVTPLIALFVGFTVAALVQRLNPELTITTMVESYVLFIMYFTIENPDIKMLQRVEIEKDRADKANQAKSDFLSSMSHEIRTPLNAIVGFSECINQSETLDEAKENAKDIIGASETLLEIVNGILDISKIESGKIELIENDYDPYKMLEETVKLARGRLGEKPLDFQVDIAPDIPKVLYGDRFNIKKILINFLTNAIKYTDTGFVRLDVKCVKLNGYVRLIFVVSDSGRGIKKEDIGKLFTKFQRLDEEKNQTIEGTGLGLAITKQLIEMMKGSVVVDSVYGEGSKFTFVLDQKISDAVLDDTTAQMNVVVDLTGKKILVVDDNKLNLKVADKLLKQYNVSVTLCNSGSDCLELIDNGNKFDVILLDDMMPQMSGTETLARLKDRQGFNIPTIALTANAINGMKEKYLNAGFDGYLSKPIDKNELYRILAKFLNPTATYDNDSNSMVIAAEDKKEEPKEEVKIEQKITQDPDVPRITKDIPKFVPDNVEIVVKPGDKQKSEEVKEETHKESTDNKSIRKAGDKKSDKIVLLIVDDNNLNIKVESKLIYALGYEVQTANSGIEAIKMVQNQKYDLIFMDIMMPMMDGVKTFHELEKLDGFDTPTIALTADAVLGAKEKYLGEGFNEYVTKPINKEELQKVIDKYIKK